jgi:cathepsin X
MRSCFLALASALLALAEARNEYRVRTAAASGCIAPSCKLEGEETFLDATPLPADFTWANAPVPGGGRHSFVTRVLNQHLPQYCGSCWAFAALASLADRIKIARGHQAQGPDVHLSVQHLLNCGTAGSCRGGSQTDVYAWLLNVSQTGDGLAFESVNPYVACSGDTSEGFCKSNAALRDAPNGECTPFGIAKDCSTFNAPCTALSQYPNATITAYGTVSGEESIKREVLAHGPVACGVAALPLTKYSGGVFNGTGADGGVDHVVSIVGWGEDNGLKYWHIRNSWGESWGEMGFGRVAIGQLQLERDCAWATPGRVTDHNFPCREDGGNCLVKGEKLMNSGAGPYAYGGSQGDNHAAGVLAP